MARYGTLGDYRFSDTQEAALDIRGAKIYGPGDHKLGEIDDVVFDEATGAIVFLVVDTGDGFPAISLSCRRRKSGHRCSMKTIFWWI